MSENVTGRKQKATMELALHGPKRQKSSLLEDDGPVLEWTPEPTTPPVGSTSLDPIEPHLLVVPENVEVPPDEPESFRSHPRFPELEVGTAGSFRVGDNYVGVGHATALRLNIFGKPNKPKAFAKITIIAETYFGEKPSIHHYAKFKNKNAGLKLSNITWFCNAPVVNFGAMTEQERSEWKPLAAPYERYCYSKKGQVCCNGLLIKLIVTLDGYLQLNVRDDNKIEKTKKLHVLIAEAEYGPRPPGLDVAHKDDNKLNCAPNNLMYQTKSENFGRAIAKYGQIVIATAQDGTVLPPFESMGKAGKHFGVQPCMIKKWCQRGQSISFQNKFWKFIFEGNPTLVKSPQLLAPTNRSWFRREDIELLKIYEFTVDGLVRKIGSNFLVSVSQPLPYHRLRLNKQLLYLHLVMLEVFHGPRPSTDHKGDHLDENKTHNCRSNLKWNAKNIERSIGKPCLRSKDGKTWEQFDSARAACRQIATEQMIVLNRHYPSIGEALRGNATTAMGYFWKFLKRGPEVIYNCPDCGKDWPKRGDWQLPAGIQVVTKFGQEEK